MANVLLSRLRGLLIFGFGFRLWTASSGFAATIETLNVVYDVPESRRIWTTRALSLGLMFLIGILLAIAVSLLLAGPTLGRWMAGIIDLAPAIAAVGPYIRWAVASASMMIAIELIYFLGPNLQQTFSRTILESIAAVGSWLGLSSLLGIYFRHFANTTKPTAPSAQRSLSVWLYWASFILFIGAEINASMLPKDRTAGAQGNDRRLEPLRNDRSHGQSGLA